MVLINGESVEGIAGLEIELEAEVEIECDVDVYECVAQEELEPEETVCGTEP